MFQRLSNSWELVKASAAVLRSDKELAIFPIVSAVGSLIVLATFAIPMFWPGCSTVCTSMEKDSNRWGCWWRSCSTSCSTL
jgi:hypothetical protein